jgi:Na+/H+ antiporter NhaD/arsenite permease-like protein
MARPALFSVLPFVVLLLMVATGPVLYPHFWHRYFSYIAVGLAGLVVTYYIAILGDTESPVASVAEYVQFIALISSLYIASSGILIDIRGRGSSFSSLFLLWGGAIIANVIGTTGASMLLIRPYMRLNKGRLKPYHIIFFIFIVSNVGGALTPIGDPPLFLGFLKGVPFFWTLKQAFLPWLLALSLLSLSFYLIDRHHDALLPSAEEAKEEGLTLRIAGGFNFVWLLLIVGSIFIDPNVFGWVPALHYHGHAHSYVREVILLCIAAAAYKLASKKVLQQNEFSFEPLQEVVFVFIGIFGTMMPALALIAQFASSPQGQALISSNTLYWGTGSLSAVLDNAPTYLTFLAAGMATKGYSIATTADVVSYAVQAAGQLRATSLAAVFFGAMTYVGNGPNFMVRAIAAHEGVAMPSFGRYVTHYALPILLPVLLVIWWVFVR